MANSRKKRQKEVGFPKRGEIYLVAFDPTIGHEIQKTRPALVIQNDISNRYSPLTIVAAISSRFASPPHPREVVIEPAESGLLNTSAVLLNQIRTVDRQRLLKRLGFLTTEQMRQIDQALKISLSLIEI